MINFHIYLSFLCFIFILAYTPGPNVLLMIRNGLEYRIQDALFSVPGIVLAIFTYALLVALGLSHILTQHPTVYSSIKVSGSIYLISNGIFGLKKIYFSREKEKNKPCLPSGSNEASTRLKIPPRFKIFTSGYICAVTNPKIFVMYMAFFPQFIDSAQNPRPQFALLGISHMMITTSSMVFYCVLANRAQNFIKKYARLQFTFTNLVLVLFGIFVLSVK